MAEPPDPSAGAAVLRTRDLEVRFGHDGTVLSVGAVARPDVLFLDAFGALAVTVPAGPLPLGPPVVAVDADEVEVERSGGGLRTLVRHSVDRTWDVRIVLANDSPDPLALTDVRVGCHADARCVVAALAAGARAAYAVQAGDGDGPLLLARLRSGAQPGVGTDAFHLGPRVLAPGHRWSVSWRFEVVPSPRDVITGDLPRTTWLDLDQTVLLPAGPDVAVVAPGLAVEPEEDRVEVGSSVAGTRVVELRGARGTTTLELTWAPDLDELVDAAASSLLDGSDGSVTPAGTVRLPDAAAGLAVQDALARRSLGSPDDLTDALELLAGVLVERVDRADVLDPVEVAFLAREADRCADRRLLDAATRALLALPLAPGAGLAGTALVLARVAADRPAADGVAHLAGLATPAPLGLASLELALLLRPRDRPADAPVLAGLRRLGTGLGAGLPGRVLPAAEPDLVAYAATLLGLVDEGTGQRLRARWGVSAAELARRASAQARARVGEGPGGAASARALAWLVLGRPPR